MYDELVERLRAGEYTLEELSIILPKAADAIEAMSEYVNTMRRLKCEGWYLQQTKFHNGCQALTTMPLPEPPKEEQVNDAPTIIEADESDMDSFIRIFEEDDDEDGMDSFIQILKD